jgi:hypothetical protein
MIKSSSQAPACLMDYGLYQLSLPNIKPMVSFGPTSPSKQELATYLHAALGSPVPSTLLRAIRRNHLVTFPGLTTNLVTKHLPKSLATVLGHQDQEAKHLRLTKALPAATTLPVSEPDLEPALDTPNHHIFAMLFDKVQIMKSYSVQTGRFPIPSSRGNHYIFVLYHHDTNSIHAVAIPNRQAASIRKAWETTHKSLIAQGHAPNLHILDNECSQELKDSFRKIQHHFPTGTSKGTSSQCCRKSHSDFQKSFHLYPLHG